jgi:hypothetical protein
VSFFSLLYLDVGSVNELLSEVSIAVGPTAAKVDQQLQSYVVSLKFSQRDNMISPLLSKVLPVDDDLMSQFRKSDMPTNLVGHCLGGQRWCEEREKLESSIMHCYPDSNLVRAHDSHDSAFALGDIYDWIFAGPLWSTWTSDRQS